MGIGGDGHVRFRRAHRLSFELRERERERGFGIGLAKAKRDCERERDDCESCVRDGGEAFTAFVGVTWRGLIGR